MTFGQVGTDEFLRAAETVEIGADTETDVVNVAIVETVAESEMTAVTIPVGVREDVIVLEKSFVVPAGHACLFLLRKAGYGKQSQNDCEKLFFHFFLKFEFNNGLLNKGAK